MKYEEVFNKLSNKDQHDEPNFWKEFRGEFISFDEKKQELVSKFPVDSRYFNPLNILLGGIMDSYMDATMGPLTVFLGRKEVTKNFRAKYVRSIDSSDQYITVVAWSESNTVDRSIYKAELFNNKNELSALSEATFVPLKKIKKTL